MNEINNERHSMNIENAKEYHQQPSIQNPERQQYMDMLQSSQNKIQNTTQQNQNETLINTDNTIEDKEYKQMKLGRIKDGTVIDHIPSELCFRLIHVLGLEKYGSVLSAATNLTSAKLGKKGMIKISGKFLTEDEVKKVAVVAPNVTMCTVNDYKVLNKMQLSLPKDIKQIVLCNNPNCITNIEEVSTNFNVITNSPLRIRCHYCERTIDKEDIKLK